MITFTKRGDEIHLDGDWPLEIYLAPDLLEKADRRFLKRRGSLVLITPANGRALYQIEAWEPNSLKDGVAILPARLLRARKDPPA